MKSVEDKILSEKDKYVEKRKTQIDKWNTELDDLESKITAANADAEAKLKHKENVTALRKKRDEARARLTEIQAASDDKWENFKDGMENIWTSIKSEFEQVKAKF